ncbi:Phage terminase small subunit [compost metagenome]
MSVHKRCINSVGGEGDDLMARERSPDRKKALALWFDSGRTMKPGEIAEKLGVSAGMVRKWKSIDRWGELPEPRPGAPKGNRNAVGNKGGPGGPVGNDKAVTHGLFRKFLPDDEETREIYDMTAELTGLDILWEGIRIQLTNIIRSLKVQHVTGKDEMIKELKKRKFEVHNVGTKKEPKMEQVVIEEEYEFQFAWDRSATALKSWAVAWTSLTRTIREYEAALRQASPDEVKDEQRARFEQLKAATAVLKAKVPNTNPKDFNNQITALAHLIQNPVPERVIDDE